MFKNYLLLSLIFIFGLKVFAGPVLEIELNKDWVLTNENGSIVIDNLEIPSGVYSALYGQDVLKSYNDINMRWIAHQNWKYSTNFTLPKKEFEEAPFVNITFHGIDTIAQISLNGKCIGKTENMFVRYSFNVKDKGLLAGENLLEVEIESPLRAANRTAAWLLNSKNMTIPPECPPPSYNGECHMNMLRKMQASFGWDWGLAAPSLGIWKLVTVELYNAAVIRDVDVAVSKTGEDWEMKVRVFLDTELSQPFYGELIFYAVELLDMPVNISYRNEPIEIPDHQTIEFNQKIPQNKVTLWWPNGYGAQKLYPLHFTLTTWDSDIGPDPRELSISQKSIRIGFRTIELVEDQMDNGYNFYFRVNGVPIFMKGTNYIPSHILPEFSNEQDRIKHLLTSARDAHMNMIRVWGGGIYESDYFYDMADYLGILIWQDMMFACSMYPTNNDFLESVRIEVIQNSKRIAHHPSVAIFAANNENEVAIAQNWYNTNDDYKTFATSYRQLYVGTIIHELGIVSYSSRPKPLTSSPTNGIQSIEENFLAKNPQDPNFGDVHFYEVAKDAWDPMIYPRPRFASEYGFQGLPSMSAWKQIMSPKDDFNELLNHRQHHPLGMIPLINLIIRHLPLPLEATDPNYNEALIYFSQISQAMVTKIETEVYRQERGTKQNTMGALYWQLNDVWVAPSWSSIDFFGNYKLLHYWAKEFLAPVSIIAHLDHRNIFNKMINITIVRDEIDNKALDVNLIVNTYLWSELFPKRTLMWPASIEPNSNKRETPIALKDLLQQPFNKNNCFFEFLIKKGNDILSKTYLFPDNIKAAVGVHDPQIKVSISSQICQGDVSSVSLSVVVQRPAIFVYIEIVSDVITTYKLSKNGFMQLEPIQTVILEFDLKSCQAFTAKNIKVKTVNQYFKLN